MATGTIPAPTIPPGPPVHPDYSAMQLRWERLMDCYYGEEIVKGLGIRYLPSTSGMRARGMRIGQPGLDEYNAYRDRASFPTVVRKSVDNLLGAMWRKPPQFELTPKLKPLLKRATTDGLGLEGLLLLINKEQLLRRAGLLCEVTDDGRPYLALYTAPTILNWNQSIRPLDGTQQLELVILDETSTQISMETFELSVVNQYSVMRIDPVTGTYKVAVFTKNFDPKQATWTIPNASGTTLQQLPFVFINTQHTQSSPEVPPLLGAADLALATYRKSADYEQSLHSCANPTFMVRGFIEGRQNSEGGEESIETGPGAILQVSESGGDAKYVEVSGNGLVEMRSGIELNLALASQEGASLLDSAGSRERESGSALQARIGSQTANLTVIADTGAKGLEDALKILARWVGDNPEDVKVIPNHDFMDVSISGQDALYWQQAKNLGFPISDESLHAYAVRRGVTVKTFKEETALLATEPVDMSLVSPTVANPSRPSGIATSPSLAAPKK